MKRKLILAVVGAVVVLVGLGAGAPFLAGTTPVDDTGQASDGSSAIQASTATDDASDSTGSVDETTDQTETASDSDGTDSDGDDADGADATETATETETETADNAPPTVELGSNRTVLEWVRVTFDAEASDADGDELNYTWEQVDGPAVDVEANGSTANFLAPDVRQKTNLTFRVTVADGDGATATDTVVVTVREPDDDDSSSNDAPTAAAGSNQSVDEDQSVALDATGSSDPDGDELGYEWTQTDGPDVGLQNASTATPSFAAPNVSETTTLTFRVTVTDDEGASDDDSVTVTVDPVASESDESAETEEKTRDDIAQAKYGADVDSLSTAEAVVVEELYLRQPANESWDPTGVRTRDEIATERYNESFDALDRDARVDVQETFDAQFGDTGANATFTRDEITQAKWGYNFSEISGESAGQVTELYDRQPWVDEEDPAEALTREQLANRRYDSDLDDMSREERLELERTYHAQFAE
jgi:hypothetical protein